MPYARGNRDGKHYWLTPPPMMAELQEEFGFDYDACPYPRPDGFDSLTEEWGESTYVNPPFESPTKWARKAIAENAKGKTVVVVFPTDKWIHYLLNAGAELRSYGDVRWHAIEDGSPGRGIGRFTMAFILRGRRPAVADSDNVNHPSHYNSGKIEVIEALEDWKLDFHLANAVKYIARAGKKDPAKTVEDLEKAVWYIRRRIALLQAEKGAEVPRPNAMPQERA